MRIALYSRAGIRHTTEELTELFRSLRENGFDTAVNESFHRLAAELVSPADLPSFRYREEDGLPTETEMLVCYGGDGTFLEGVRLTDTRPIPVFGINSGRLGFLANVSKKDMTGAIRLLAEGAYTVDRRSLLHVTGDFGGEIRYPYAFNEFSVQKKGVSMISVEVSVDREFVAEYHGDGIILSTPVGSTAYAMSVGGPIVSPESRCFVLAPIASHILSMRPLILADTGEIEFRIRSREETAVATLDNRDFTVGNDAVFRVRKSDKPVFLVRLNTISFFRTLRDKMMWGVDSRMLTK